MLQQKYIRQWTHQLFLGMWEVLRGNGAKLTFKDAP